METLKVNYMGIQEWSAAWQSELQLFVPAPTNLRAEKHENASR